MAYIVGFAVTGLAGREGTYRKDLNRDTNVFFGPNGSGKTSLLKILDSALSDDAVTLERVPFSEAHVEVYSTNKQMALYRSTSKVPRPRESEDVLASGIRSEFAGLTPRQLRELAERHGAITWQTLPTAREGEATRFLHRYLPTSRLYPLDDRPGPRGVELRAMREEMPTEDALDWLFARSVDRLWDRYSSEILREVRAAQEAGLASILRAVLSPSRDDGDRRQGPSPLDPDRAYTTIERFLERQGSTDLLATAPDFKLRYGEEPMLQRIVDDIQGIERRVEQAMAPRERLRSLIGQMFTGPKTILFEDRSIHVKGEDGCAIGLASLSSGEKHLLRILVEALLAGDGTLIIDEPELSLHVDWQRELLGAMRILNPAAQVIAATHCPEILAHIPDESIFAIG